MDADLMRAERDLQETYWWFVGRRAILKSVLQRFVKRVPIAVDIGCGSGRNLQLLAPHSDCVIGIDQSLASLGFSGSENITAVMADGQAIPLADSSVDLVSALDVLEHLDDDIGALEEFRRIVRPHGFLLVTVPAYRFLWSEHDEALMHRRRYGASELHAMLNRAGFRVIKRTYVVFFPFIPIAAYRLFRGLFPEDPSKPTASHVILPAPLNRFFIALLKLEARIIRAINLPFGTSILILAQKSSKETARKT